MPRRQKNRDHVPNAATQWGVRLGDLRELLAADPQAAGDQALKVLEEYLEQLAHDAGYRGEGSMGRYGMFLRGRGPFDEAHLNQIEGYTQVRNCLAHTYGLQVSAALAEEVIDFLADLLGQTTLAAINLMSREVQIVAAAAPLHQARDTMLKGGYSRLPVLRGGDGVIGLLTERDIVAAQAQAEAHKQPFNTLHVVDALPPDAAARVVFLPTDAGLDLVTAALRRAEVLACLITSDGTARGRVLGIVTHADLLARMR